MAIIAVVHAVEDHFGDGLLAAGAFAAGFVVHHLGKAPVLGQKLGHGGVGRGTGDLGHFHLAHGGRGRGSNFIR